MGNDGGSIPKRRELVKEAARQPSATAIRESLLENLTHAWTTCPLSSNPLDLSNTVSDASGRLYNYEAVLQCLLPQSDAPVTDAQEQAFQETGIRSLRDVQRLRFTLRKDERSGRDICSCPISMKELGAANKAVYIVPCGHVFADMAMKTIAAVEEKEGTGAAGDGACPGKKQCLECSEPFEEANVVPILPATFEDTTRLNDRIRDLKGRGLTHTLSKDKSAKEKKKKRRAGENGIEAEEKTSKKSRPQKDDENKRTSAHNGGIESRINNPATASLTAKVLAEQEAASKRRKMLEGRG